MPDLARTSLSPSRYWLLALLPLLLTAVLVIPALGDIALNGDEPASLVAAGMFRPGPLSLAEVWKFTAEEDPDQAQGWPLLLSIWGRLAGWGEVAARTLPLFGGLLALAWVYRAGNDLFSAQAGIFAALLLSASMFPQTNMLHARVFPLVMLFTTWSLWAYWRCTLHPRPPARWDQAGLLASVTGLLYWQYFGALLLPVLGLFHLLFVPKNRRWWRTVLLLGLAALASVPQLPGLLDGIALTGTREPGAQYRPDGPRSCWRSFFAIWSMASSPPTPWVGDVAGHPLAARAVGGHPVAAARQAPGRRRLAAHLRLCLAAAADHCRQRSAQNCVGKAHALPDRAVATAGPADRRRPPAAGRRASTPRGSPADVLWLVLGVSLALTSDLRYELGYFSQSSIHRLMPVMSEQISPSDFLIQDYHVAALDTRRYYARLLDVDWVTIGRFQEDPFESIRPVHAAYPYAWLLYLTKDRVGFAELPQALGRVFCERALEEWGLTLERYALHSVENCPDRPVRLEFERDIRLAAPEITLRDGRLRLDAHFRSVDETLARPLLPRRARHRPAQRPAHCPGRRGRRPWRHRPAAQRNRRPRPAAGRIRAARRAL